MPSDESVKSSWVIGRAEDCDLIVPEPTVGKHHCRLTAQNGQFILEDLNSRNGTFVHGKKLPPNEPTPVEYGTSVKLGGAAEMPWPAMPMTGRRVTVVAPEAHRGADRGVITIGRNPKSDVPVDLPTVSWNHAIIHEENRQYIIEDLKSLNGTAIGQLSNRIERAVLDPSQDVFFGSYKIPASKLVSRDRKIEIGEAARQKIAFPRNKEFIEIGRDPSCDHPLSNPMISWRHARLTRAPEGILVEDLGSRNGTYVDGIRITTKVLVKPGQDVGLGSFRIQLDADGELVERKYYGNVTIEAKDITVFDPKGEKCLLSPISLTVFPSELVAVMGPAGAGKTTLLKALNGYTKPHDGSVLFNGSDLYRYYDRFRQQMGYVPQDDIMHSQLTVREAIRFSAKLRTDLTEDEISVRMEKILKDLDIADRIDKIIGSPERKLLSGGQRKRVNIALELITDTPVLFLDEPTSGLSSYDADAVIELLKGLARSGKTVITTIHQPSLKVYKQFDDLIMISRDTQDESGSKKTGAQKPGTMVFFGPAYPDSIQFFNPSGMNASGELAPEMIFEGMNNVPKDGRTEFWRRRYDASRYQSEFVSSRAGKQPADRGATGEETARRQFGLKQWFALVARNVIVKLRDRAQTAILLFQAPFFAGLIFMISGHIEANDDLPEKLLITHFLMVLAAIWFGCNNAARDIVGEWTIYRRERMVTLKLLPYVFSKVTVLLVLCIFQCASMLAIVYLACQLKSNFLREFATLLVASLIGAGIGLFISAYSKTTESAIALLPVALLPIIALAGALRPIYQLPLAGRAVSAVIASRWAFEANLLQEAREWQWPAQPANTNANSSQQPGPAGMSDQCPNDAAQRSFPTCVVDTGDGAGRLRHLTDEEYTGRASAPATIKIRHSYRDSMLVLCSMVVLSLIAVIFRLWMRDKDPQ